MSTLGDHLRQVPDHLTTSAAFLQRPVAGTRYPGDDRSELDLADRAGWPEAAEGAYVAFIATQKTELRRQLTANRQHARNAWLRRRDGTRYPGDDGDAALDLAKRLDWLTAAEGAYVAFLGPLDAAHSAAKTFHGV